MKSLRLFSTLIIVALFVQNLFAQSNLTLYNMSVIPQAAYTNPAFMPDKKINIGLPVISSLYLGVSNNGFKFSDLVKKRPDDSTYFDQGNMISKLAKNNYLNLALQADLFSFGIVVKKNYFTFNVTEKMGVNFRYSKDFMEFASKGNGALLGQETKFNFGLNISHYREYGVGMARVLSEKLTVGAKLKYLYGMENIHAATTDVSQITEPNTFDITAKSNILINTSGLDSTSVFGLGKKSKSDSSRKNFNPVTYLFQKKNSGLGIDLGGTYQLTEKITLSASLLDLGFISWKTEVTNLVSRNPDANVTFKGIDFNSFIGSGGKTVNTNSVFSKMGDSLGNTFGINQTHNSYRTALATQFYIGAKYMLHPKFNVGGLIYGQFFDGQLHPGLSLSGNAKLTKWFSTSLSYSMINRSYNNVGLGFAITSPVQFYVVMDNILAPFNLAKYDGPYKKDPQGNPTTERKFQIIAPQGAKNLNVRFGINITFGKIHKKEKEEDAVGPNSLY